MQAFEHRESVRAYALSLGHLAPFAFISLQALQVVISPIPGEATGFIGGFLFGKWAGFFYSSVGLTLGSAIAFFLSRQFRRLVRLWLLRSRLYGRFEHLAEHQGLFIFYILFLFPGFPKDFLCYLLGLSRMPWLAFIAIVILGRMPGTLVLALQGANTYDKDIEGFVSILFLSLLVLVPSLYYRERIYQWVETHSLKE
ncbi:MAG: TVP38/TMEM64 family protein [Deltaproteobacteria bacterium]|nr:TVP38/TMEM64 family protein [Deltaproteobacteria bacterium]